MPETTAEVTIVGGGVIGAAIAWQLARRGIQPLLIEREDPAAGSSGACDGLVFLQSKKPGLHLRLALESRRRFDALAEILGPGIEFRPAGGLCLIETEAELEAMRRLVAEQHAAGLAVELIAGGELRRLEPLLSERVIAATCSPCDAQVNPYALTFALIREACTAGARLLAGEPVTGIEVASGRVQAVRTPQRRIPTPIVVNAAGAHAPEIGRLAGIEIPITPRRGQILVTAPRPPLLRHGMISARYIAAKFNPELAAAGEMGFSLEQAESGNLLIGSTREFAGFDRRTTFAGIRAVARRILPLFPALASLPVIRTFAGLRPYTPDGLPILGPVAAIEGFWMAAGHEGDGIALSAVTGELVASSIVGETPLLPLDPFRLERFFQEGA